MAKATKKRQTKQECTLANTKQTNGCLRKQDSNEFNRYQQMGQAQSTHDLTGSEINEISNKLKPKLKLANQIEQNLLAANYLDDEFLQKIIKIVKNHTKGKIKSLDSPWRERFNALSLDENNLLYIDD